MRGGRPCVFQHNDFLPSAGVGAAVRAAAARRRPRRSRPRARSREDLDSQGRLPSRRSTRGRPGSLLPSPCPSERAAGAGARRDRGLEAPGSRARGRGAGPAPAPRPADAAWRARPSRASEDRTASQTCGHAPRSPTWRGCVRCRADVTDSRGRARRATCLLHCADREPFGMALVEALACGRPVAAPRAGGPMEILDESCGRLYGPDAAAAAAALVEVAEARAAVVRRGARTRHVVTSTLLARRRAFASRWRRCADDPGAAVAINARAAVRREIGGVERVAASWPRTCRARTGAAIAYSRRRPALAHRRGHAWEQLAPAALARGSALILSPANLAPVAACERGDDPGRGARSSALVRRRVLALASPAAAATGARCATGSRPLDRGSRPAGEVLRADPARTRVVPLGVDERFSQAQDSERVAARHGLNGPTCWPWEATCRGRTSSLDGMPSTGRSWPGGGPGRLWPAATCGAAPTPSLPRLRERSRPAGASTPARRHL